MRRGLTSSNGCLISMMVGPNGLVVVRVSGSRNIYVSSYTRLDHCIRNRLSHSIRSFRLRINSTKVASPFGILHRCIGGVNGRIRVLLGDNAGLANMLGSTSRGKIIIAIRGRIGPRKTGHGIAIQRSRSCAFSRVGCAGCLVEFGWGSCNRREKGGRCS